MKKQITAFFTALSFYTRIPCYKLGSYSSEDLAISIKFLPLIGLIVASVGAGVFYLSNHFLPNNISILLSMISTILLTGAFHEDGFADSLDGFGGGWEKEDVRRIMKDSAIGSYGTIGLILILALKYFLLSDINIHYFFPILLAGHSISRFVAISYVNTHTYVTTENSKSCQLCHKETVLGFIFSLVCSILPMFWLPKIYWLAIIPIFFVRMFYGLYLTKRLGGYTGDSLGFAQQISEIVFYLCAVAV